MINIREHIATGVDAKILQYEENAIELSDNTIDLIKLLGGKQNCILMNLEKDVDRYNSSLQQFKKVSIKKFVHVKGTDGRNVNKTFLENDLTYILQFLSQFNSDIKKQPIKINQFSEINDNNVLIQDGPLGCYCSHLRAMIYGYLNFEDYTIICEDDISITNTNKIEKYIQQIPDDWDIITLNSRPKNIRYEDPFYKFVDEFHSTHFYIIRHRVMPKLFSNLYPITDQVDVLISNLHNQINIYNIPDTVYQKNIKTNTQNNLHVIANSPHYNVVREIIQKIENTLNYFANKILPDNEKRNSIITKNLMHDVIYNFILHENLIREGEFVENYQFENIYQDTQEFETLVKSIHFFIQCSKKGINVFRSSQSLANILLFTLHKFNLHNQMSREGTMKAYSFGASAHTYNIDNQYIIKKYNDKLRWTTTGHDNPEEIFQKEVVMLQKIRKIKGCPTILTSGDLTIKMIYNGESLYNDFNLPQNWELQINQIFDELTKNGIYYSEFRLQNILILNDEITFVDFGLAEFRDDCDNSENLEKFIKYITLFEDKFKQVEDLDDRHRLISTFSINQEL